MSTVADEPDPLKQTATRCDVLGIDREGAEHVFDPERGRVVVLDREGIQVQYDIDVDEKATWMAYVEAERGWRHEQWLGWRLKDVLFGGE